MSTIQDKTMLHKNFPNILYAVMWDIAIWIHPLLYIPYIHDKIRNYIVRWPSSQHECLTRNAVIYVYVDAKALRSVVVCVCGEEIGGRTGRKAKS